MTDYRILTAGDVLAIPAEFDVAHWNVGRSGDLGAGVEVWTSLLPVPKGGEGTQVRYSTLVNLPDRDTLKASYWRNFMTDEWMSCSRDAALETHRSVVNVVQAWLAGVGV